MDSANRTDVDVLTNCSTALNQVVWLYLIVLLCLSVVILIVLSFFQRRRKRHDCLWGFPGIVKPMDFLVTPRHRFVYIVIFGVMSQSLFTTFQSIGSPPGIGFYFSIVYTTLITPLLVVLILALQYFPLFACINASIPLLGHCIGFVYSFLWLGYFVTLLVVRFPLTICLNRPTPTFLSLLSVAEFLLIIGAAVVIVVWYGFKTVQGIFAFFGVGRKVWKQDFICCGNTIELKVTDPPRTGVKLYHLLHVQRLFQEHLKDKDITKGKGEIFVKKVFNYVFPYSRDFRLPLPFVGAVFAMSMILYQFTIVFLISASEIATRLPPLFDSVINPIISLVLNATVSTLEANSTTSEFIDSVRTVYSGIDELFGLILVGFPAFLVVCPIVSLVFCLCLMINMVATVSKQLKKVARVGFKDIKLPSPVRRVPSSWKYVGYLIGFFSLAWFIYTFVVFLVLVVVSLIYLGFRYLPRPTFQVVLYIAIPLVWTQLVLLFQSLLCRFIFFEDQKGNFIAIKNRRLFNWFAYVLFFYNGIAGFVSAILRTLMSTIFSLLLLFRLDQVVLIRGFEQFDFGHTSYLGFIYLDSTYNNAVMHVFLHLLQTETQQTPAEVNSYTINSTSRIKEGGRRARNRWLVAYTLVKNPSLVRHTAANLELEQSRAASESEEMQDMEDSRYKAPLVVVPASYDESDDASYVKLEH